MALSLPVGLSKVRTDGGLKFLHAEKSQSGSTELFHMMGGLHILVDGTTWVKFTDKAIVKQYQAKINHFEMAEARAWKETQKMLLKTKRDKEKIEAAMINEAAKLQKVKDKQEKTKPKSAMKRTKANSVMKGSKTKKAMKAKSAMKGSTKKAMKVKSS